MLTLCLLALLGIYAVALLVLRPSTSGKHLPLSGVVSLGDDSKVLSARFLDEDARIVGTAVLDDQPQKFWTAYPRSDAATNDLLKTFLTHDTRVTISSQSGKALVKFLAQFLLPLVVLANLFAILFFASRGSEGDHLIGFSRIGDKRLARASGAGPRSWTWLLPTRPSSSWPRFATTSPMRPTSRGWARWRRKAS